MRTFKHLGGLVPLILALGACAEQEPIARSVDASYYAPTVISEAPRWQDVKIDKRVESEVINKSTSAVNTIALEGRLEERRLSGGESLPATINIPVTNLSLVPVTTALQAVLAGSQIDLSSTEAVAERTVTVENLSGPLTTVVDTMCAAAEIFCTYRHGILELQTKESFIVDIPPDAKNVRVLSALGDGIRDILTPSSDSEIHTDPQGESLIYTADVAGQKRVHTYLEQLRHGRPLVANQIYAWDVTLDKKDREGVPWSDAKIVHRDKPKSVTEISVQPKFTSVGDLNLTAVSLDQFSMPPLAEFLSKHGRVQAVDNLQMAYVAGGKLASFVEQGTKQDVKEASALPESLYAVDKRKALDIEMSGIYDKGFIVTDLKLVLKNAGMSNNKLDTTIRLQPGDNIVLSAVLLPKESQANNNPSAYKNAHQFILAMKSSLFEFANNPVKSKYVPQASMVTSVGSPPLSSDWPEPIIIDKDGVQPYTPSMHREIIQHPPSAFPTIQDMPEDASDGVIANRTNASVLEPSTLSADDEESVDLKLRQHGVSPIYRGDNNLSLPKPITQPGGR